MANVEKEGINFEFLAEKEIFNRDQIQEFLDTAEHRGDLILGPILKLIKDLSPGPIENLGGIWPQGELYSITNDEKEKMFLYPDQLVYRKMVDKRVGRESPCDLLEEVLNRQGYWDLWSLLGLFLSLKYKAVSFSTKKDFFARLTTMYGWWCITIAPKEGKAENYPGAYQCTWRQRKIDGDGFNFFLGHSFGGPKGPAEWKEVVKKRRCALLSDILTCDMEERWGWDRSPDIIDRPGGTNFGNCGETYPFLALMMSKTKPDNAWGYALSKLCLKPSIPKTYDPGRAKQYYMPPCCNCTELLRILDGNVDNFKIDNGWDDGALS